MSTTEELRASAVTAGARERTRLVPRAVRPSRRFRHVLARDLRVARTLWATVGSAFVEPVLYLLALGFGLEQLVGDVETAAGPVRYAAFVAPGLMAAAAMTGAAFESTMNFYAKLKYDHTFDAMLATPLGVGDVALGEITYGQLRGAVYAGAFLLVMWATGLVASPWALLALPSAVLIGLAFAALGTWSATFLRGWHDFDLVPAAVFPLFLFSATFFPLGVYPDGAQWLVRLSPLYHGVELTRALVLGQPHVGLLGHAAVLVGVALLGGLLAARRLERLLLR